MALTQEQADLIYAALVHLHDAEYVQLTDFPRNRVVKPSDETINNDAVLHNDADLHFPAVVNGLYFVRGVLKIATVTTTPKFRPSWSGPVGCGAAWRLPVSFQGASPAALIDLGQVLQVNCIAGTWGLEVEGWFQNGATAGDIGFQWAQWAATAENTTVKAGSWLTYEKLN